RGPKCHPQQPPPWARAGLDSLTQPPYPGRWTSSGPDGRTPPSCDCRTRWRSGDLRPASFLVALRRFSLAAHGNSHLVGQGWCSRKTPRVPALAYGVIMALSRRAQLMLGGGSAVLLGGILGLALWSLWWRRYRPGGQPVARFRRTRVAVVAAG